MKSAIVILSDPENGTDALGRVFNGLATAYDYKQQGDDVTILFQGAGTRWIGELSKSDHPAHGLFEAVKDAVAGVSPACAAVFGASEEVENSPFKFIGDNAVPGTKGLPSLRRLAADGYTVMSF